MTESTALKVSISIDVPDLLAATTFYTDGLGCTKVREQGKSMVVLSAGNTEIYLIEHGESTNPTPAADKTTTRTFKRHWTPVHLDFLVHDVDAAVAKITACGGTREGGEKGSWGAIAHCADPFGNGFCLIRE